MARRYFGNLSINVIYDDSDRYRVSVSGNRASLSFIIHPSKSGFGPGVAYDSPKAYDEIARSAVSFATTPSGGDSEVEREKMSLLDDAAHSGPHAGQFHRPKTGSVKNPTHRRKSHSASRRNPTRGPADVHAARELVLFAENDELLYRQMRRPIELNLLSKYKAGKYSSALAHKAWMHFADAAAKKYAKEFASPREWNTIFTPATRHAAAIQMRDAWEAELPHAAKGWKK